MALPEIIRPGSRVARDYLNALRDTARRAAIQLAGAGLSALDTPGGMVVQLNPGEEARANCARMEYAGQVTGETLPPGSVVHILNSMDESGIQQFDLPDYSGRQRLGILIEGAAPGNCPWVQYQGIAVALADLTTWPGSTGAASGRMGARASSPYAQRDPTGALYAPTASFAADPALNLPANIQAAVVFLEQRRAAVTAHCVIPGTFIGDARGGLVSSWVFGPAFQLEEAKITPPEGFDPFDAIDGGDISVVGL